MFRWTPEQARRYRLGMNYGIVAYGVLFVVVSIAFLLRAWSWVLIGLLIIGVLFLALGIKRVRSMKNGPPSHTQG